MSQVMELPLWREAVKNFIQLGMVPGDVISKEWLMKEFGIAEPETANEFKEASLKFVSMFDRFRVELLEIHRIDLESVHGVGYRLIHPKDQAKIALIKRTRNIGKELKEMGRSVKFTNTEALTDVERQEHTDVATKAAAIGAMFNRRKLLGRV